MQLDSLFQKDIKSINYNDIVNLVQNQTPESDQLEYKIVFEIKRKFFHWNVYLLIISLIYSNVMNVREIGELGL